jgi:surface antigen
MHRKLWVALAVTAPLLAGCASSVAELTPYSAMPREPGRNLVEDTGQKPLQCVPYARDHSGVKIFGDAYTWWDKASGKFQRASMPASGAVMVLSGYAGPERGHVAVVQKIVSPREIRVDHANWLDDGSIFINDPVEDVSTENDWSAVRVWNIKTGNWGSHNYPVQGFILPSPPTPADTKVGDGFVARADIAGEEQ